MKQKLFVILLCSLFFSNLVKSQVIESKSAFFKDWGVKIGFNFQQIIGDNWACSYNSGILGGAYVNYNRGKIGFRLEALMSEGTYYTSHQLTYFPERKGTPPAGADTFQKGDFSSINLRVPLLMQFNLYKSLKFLIGPEFSYQTYMMDNNGAFIKDFGSKATSNLFRKGEFYVDLGLEARLHRRITVAFRYCMGLSNINKGAVNQNYDYLRTYDNWKLWALQTTFGFKL